MLILFAIWVFLIGILIGSFLNVLADRLSNGQNPFKGRSHCDFCKKTLSAVDLVPLFSYLLLKGRCRHCHAKLSICYPLSEFATGLIFVMIFLVLANNYSNQQLWSSAFVIDFAYYLFLSSMLIVIFFADFKYGIIPFLIVLAGFGAALLYTIFITPQLLFVSLLSGLGGFVFLLLIFLITRGKGMGFGDVVYMFLMGFVLSFPGVILGFYISVVLGGLFALVLIALKRKKWKGSTIPFGPFLVIGTIVSIFWGNEIISKVFGYLHI